MACLVFGQSTGVCAATIIFYTCIWIPFLEIKKLLVKIKGFILHSEAQEKWWLVDADADTDLPMARFQGLDLDADGGRTSAAAAEEETMMTCWVCLLKMEGEEVVSRLQICGHVFHTRCIQSWIRQCRRRHHFTCPLCRTSLFLLHRHQFASIAAPAHHLSVPSHG